MLFDRSWYNRAGVERVMGFCTDDEYDEFLRAVRRVRADARQRRAPSLVKLWFSVSRREQITRFTIRRIDPVRQWKLSPMDLASLDRWDDYTAAKEAMFQRHPHATTRRGPIVRSNDKKRGRVEAMRFVLHQLDYPDKDVARGRHTRPVDRRVVAVDGP